MENLEDNLGSACTLIDHTEAFDTVDHKILLEKYKLYGLRGKAISFLRSYLNNGKQYVIYSDSISDIKTIYVGVPRGSVLGALLFLMYTNDLSNVCRRIKSVLFAGDCALCTTTETGNQRQMNSEKKNKIERFFESKKVFGE